jgi:heat shock protein HslJ
MVLMEKPNKSKLVNSIIYTGIFLIVAILAFKYFAPKIDQLPSKEVWGLTKVIISGQTFSPLDAYQETTSSGPQIILTNQSEYRGFDGCNAYQGKFFYLENSYVKFYQPESTLLGCRNPGQGMAETSFLKALQMVHQYEKSADKLLFFYSFSSKNVTMEFTPVSNPHKAIDLGEMRPECHFLLMVTLRDLCFFDKERY